MSWRTNGYEHYGTVSPGIFELATGHRGSCCNLVSNDVGINNGQFGLGRSNQHHGI